MNSKSWNANESETVRPRVHELQSIMIWTGTVGMERWFHDLGGDIFQQCMTSMLTQYREDVFSGNSALESQKWLGEICHTDHILHTILTGWRHIPNLCLIYRKMGWIGTVGWIRTKLNWQFLLILTPQRDSNIWLVLMMISVIYCNIRTWLNNMNLCSTIFIIISIFPTIHFFL